MSNLIKVYDQIKGWVKPSERTKTYCPPKIIHRVAPRDSDVIECPSCKTGTLILKGKPCGTCAALNRNLVSL